MICCENCKTKFKQTHYYCPSCGNDKFREINKEPETINREESNLLPLKKITDFRGKIGRKKYIGAILIILVLNLLSLNLFNYIQMIETQSYIKELMAFVFIFALIYSSLAILSLGKKRCSDLGVSGYYQFIPLYFLFMVFKNGINKEKNKIEESIVYLFGPIISNLISIYFILTLLKEINPNFDRSDNFLSLIFILYFAASIFYFSYTLIKFKYYKKNHLELRILEKTLERKKILTILNQIRNEE